MTKKIKKQITGELVFGVHPVLELLKLKRRKVLALYVTKIEPKAWPQVERLLPNYPVTVHRVDRDVLNRMAGTSDHQNILALAQPFPYRKKFFEPDKAPFLVMLDGIQDPRNLGAILRSAYCTGVDGVIVAQRGASPLTATALKASAGLAERLEIYLVSSALQAAKELQAAGYTLYLTTFDGKNAVATTYKMPLCLVIGGEGEGISPNIMSMGERITIPQRTKDISYNASVAAGIVMFMVANKQGIIK